MFTQPVLCIKLKNSQKEKLHQHIAILKSIFLVSVAPQSMIGLISYHHSKISKHEEEGILIFKRFTLQTVLEMKYAESLHYNQTFMNIKLQ